MLSSKVSHNKITSVQYFNILCACWEDKRLKFIGPQMFNDLKNSKYYQHVAGAGNPSS